MNYMKCFIYKYSKYKSNDPYYVLSNLLMKSSTYKVMHDKYFPLYYNLIGIVLILF